MIAAVGTFRFLVCMAVIAVAFFALGRETAEFRFCRHDWRPDGFADWRCSRCGRMR